MRFHNYHHAAAHIVKFITCATTSLAPQLIGVLTGKGTSGVVIDKLSKEGLMLGERNPKSHPFQLDALLLSE